MYVVGLSARVADPEMLKKPEYFGKYGKITKVCVFILEFFYLCMRRLLWEQPRLVLLEVQVTLRMSRI